jgi:imidazolonepropionase-like amidohydrolase
MAKWRDMEYVSSEAIGQWTKAKMRNIAAQPLETRREYLAIRRRLLKTLYDSGVKFLLGSDAPQTWQVPGFSIHRELAALVVSGLTPYQALETGTRNVALFLKMEDRAGTVGVGKRADLLLLTANPLQDVANAQRITGVMLQGRWLPRVEIERQVRE